MPVIESSRNRIRSSDLGTRGSATAREGRNKKVTIENISSNGDRKFFFDGIMNPVCMDNLRVDVVIGAYMYGRGAHHYRPRSEPVKINKKVGRRGSESRITWIPKDRLDHYRRNKQLVDCLSCLLLEFLRVALTDATLMMRPLYYAYEYRPQASRREDDTEGLKQAVRNVRLICL